MSTERYEGIVKWFSNKKGYGFITSTCPALSHVEDDSGSPIPSDIFVHQSTILSTGYRTLDEGWPVEFSIGYDHDGKPKAENVSAPGGGVCTGPRRPRYHRARKTGYGEGDGEAPGSEGAAKPMPIWHHQLSDKVKDSLHEKNIATVTGTIDIAVGKARIKLGTRSYSSMAHADRILVEGSFQCDTDGNVLFHWKRAIHFVEGSWKMYPPASDTSSDISTDENLVPITNLDMGEDASKIIREVNLSQDTVHAVKLNENITTLMGETVTDPPRSVFEKGGFEMRRVVLTTKKRVIGGSGIGRT